jgi:glycosyltransferase involved in cell wall biosynthesis
MKIAQLTTTTSGGAGIAAVRLSSALAKAGADSSLISQRSKNESTSIASKVATAFQSKVVQSGPNLVTTFSMTQIELDKLEYFDVLHFHSTYNLINSRSLFNLAATKKIVLTLHDQRAFTGGCHYSQDCIQFENSCSACPQVKRPFRKCVSFEKTRMDKLINLKNVHVVAPSFWLTQMANKIVKQGNRVQTIRNPIPKNEYPSLELVAQNKTCQENTFVIGFVAAQINNPVKGFMDLVQALKYLPAELKSRVHLLVIGKGRLPKELDEVKVTQIQNFQRGSEINPYGAMNLLIVPSREDNSPNVIGEALMSNVRVLGSSVGGVPELLRLFECPIVDTTDTRKFSKSILDEILRPRINNYSKLAEKVFGYEVIAQEMLKFYQSCIRI